jgi:putative transposase
MPLKNRYTIGEKWILPEGDFLFVRELAGARMLFESEVGDGHIIRTEVELDRLRETRQARRVRQFRDRKGRIQRANEAGDLPPEGPSDKDQARQFYVKKWDEFPCGTGETALRRFIAYHKPEALRRGLTWAISPSTLKRAINERGEPGNRPLRVMQDMRGKGPRKRSDSLLQEIVRRTVAWYYAKRERDIADAHAWSVRFVKHVNGIMKIRHKDTWRAITPRVYETVRLRVHAAVNLRTLTAKLGKHEARWRLQGVKRGLQAKVILECVLIDGSVVDGWCVLDDDNQIPAGRPTITLAIDLRSRVVLGVIITFEGESLFAIMACLQQVITGKHDIIERLPQFRDLLEDLYGKPASIVVDNAWRQTGVSFQDACEDGGINIEWAPVKNPE